MNKHSTPEQQEAESNKMWAIMQDMYNKNERSFILECKLGIRVLEDKGLKFPTLLVSGGICRLMSNKAMSDVPEE